MAEKNDLDQMLDAVAKLTPASDALTNAILAIPTQYNQVAPRRSFFADWDFGFLIPRLGGAMAAGFVGFYLGITGLVTLPSQDSTELAWDLSDMAYVVLSEEGEEES